MKRFRVTYALDVTLNAEDIWPDGDAPENPTAEDVADLICKEGGFPKIIEEWNLDNGLDPNNFDVAEEP